MGLAPANGQVDIMQYPGIAADLLVRAEGK
jgi:hypothetical protein